MKKWVVALADDLTSSGFNVLYDGKSHKLGEANAKFMRESCQIANWILCVSTPEYRKRCKEKGRGLEYEAQWIENRMREIGSDHVIPLLRKGRPAESLPPFKDHTNPLDLTKDEDYGNGLKTLLEAMGSPRLGSAPQPPVWRAGVLLVCDIEGFSQLERGPQEEIMARMWAELESLEGRADLRWDHAFPLLDGCGLIWELPKGRDVHAAALEAGQELVKRVRTRNGPLVLRAGLHQGPFTFRKREGEGHHFWGEGLNDASRAAYLGDAGHLLLTETFFLTAEGPTAKNLKLHVEPGRDLPPYEVFPAQGNKGQVRIHLGKGLNHGDSSKLKILALAVDKLSEDLSDLAWEFGQALTNLGKAAFPDLLPRATLWVPDPVEPNHLHATSHRYRILENAEGELEVKTGPRSRTRYATAEPGEGPPGMAWTNGRDRAVVAHGLPDYGTDPEGYIKALEAFGVPRNKVEHLGYKSRMIAACAFPLKRNDAGPPVGVVCLDAALPLEDIPLEKLEEMTAELVSGYSTALTLAWKFRI